MKNVRLKIGDSVRVKNGVIDSDFEKYDMGGWEGRIIGFTYEEEHLEIELDSITLKQLPNDYITDSLNNGSDYTVMYYSIYNVKLTEPRDTKDEVKKTRLELNKKLNFVSELDKEELFDY